MRSLPLLGGEQAVLTPERRQAREWAAGELSGSEYDEDGNWLLQLWHWIDARLRELDVPALGTSWSGPVFIAAVLLVLVVVVLLVAGPVRRTVAGAQPRAVFTEQDLSAQEHRALAEAAAAAGRYEVAVEERFRALVRSGEERSLLQRRPGRTAAEAGAEMGAWLPGRADRLRAAARTFDDVRYGGRAADATAYRFLAALDEEVRDARPAAVRAAAADGAGAGGR